MASKAWKAFKENAEDIQRLLELHSETGGPAPGRRFGLEVLNKSAIVLITAIWEAYCEDLASEALEHLVSNAASSDVLSKHIKQQVAKELKADHNEVAIWTIAGEGWRPFLKARLDDLKAKRDRRLNTPRAAEIDELFLTAIGLEGVSDAWTWKQMNAEKARSKLDYFITLRGAIAHRGSPAGQVYKKQVEDYFAFVLRIVAKTGGRVNTFVNRATGQTLW